VALSPVQGHRRAQSLIRFRAFAFHAALLAWLFAYASPASAEPELRIGSKRFTESYVLAEIAVAAVKTAGGSATHEQGLGGTAVAFRALEQGSIDAYPEYTGTLAEAILHASGQEDLPSLRLALAARGIRITAPLGFDDAYGIAVESKLVAARHLETLSDLARTPDLRLGFSPEFLGRSDGFPGLAARYGISSAHATQIDHGLAYEALIHGVIDATDVYSTDAAVGRYGLRVLRDDLGFFPSYEAVFLYRQESARRSPLAMQALFALEGSIDASTMVALNARAEVNGETFASIGEDFVRARIAPIVAPPGGGTASPGTRPSGGSSVHRQGLLGGIASTVVAEGPRHVSLVAVSLACAIVFGVPLGILARRARRLGAVLLGATSVVQTVPSLALLCFFIPLLGTGRLPALAALFLYYLLPIARNTVAGLETIPPLLRESAAALGLGAGARLFRVELPLASPTILAGIRTSAIISVGTATLAAFIGAGGFGAPISTGLNLNDDTLILEGAIPAALLALLVEALFVLLGRLLVPRGLASSAVASQRALVSSRKSSTNASPKEIAHAQPVRPHRADDE
jgi:osmoprotectant transport system permease protein